METPPSHFAEEEEEREKLRVIVIDGMSFRGQRVAMNILWL